MDSIICNWFMCYRSDVLGNCWVPRCLRIVYGMIVSHVSVSHILFIYVLIKTIMIHAVCSSKSKTEFISSDKVDPGNHMSTELKSLVTATKDANTSIVHRQNLRSRHARFLYSKCLKMLSVNSVNVKHEAKCHVRPCDREPSRIPVK